MSSSSHNEVSHYVVTAHPPGAVLTSAKCNFMSPQSVDVLVAKSNRLEVRQLRTSTSSATGVEENNNNTPGGDTFPVLLQLPIHGRILALEPLRGCIPSLPTTPVFIMQDRYHYAVISYAPSNVGRRVAVTGKKPASGYDVPRVSPYPLVTHASGCLKTAGGGDYGRTNEEGPIVAVDHHNNNSTYGPRCIAIHCFEGLITILPIDGRTYRPPPDAQLKADDSTSASNPRRPKQLLGNPFHCRVEEETILAMTFLPSTTTPGGRGSGGAPLLQLAVLYQDSRGSQHLTTHTINLQKQQMHLCGSGAAGSTPSAAGNNNVQSSWLKKSNVDGGSSLLIPVVGPTSSKPPRPAVAAAASATAEPNPRGSSSSTAVPPPPPPPGVVIVGQRQFTYCSPTSSKIIPVPQALFLAYTELPADPTTGMPRFLLADEFGNLHMLSLMSVKDRVVALQLETLGSCTLATTLAYLGAGLLYVGSALGDSQLVQIHDEPIPLLDSGLEETEPTGTSEEDMLLDTTYLSVIEEYTNLGCIVDFDLVPTAPGGAAGGGGQHPSSSGGHPPPPSSTLPQVVQSQVVTASGSSKLGSLRVIRNGIGMNEYASVEIPGIQAMWSLRKSYLDQEDAYLVQSFVGETRVLGVSSFTSGAVAGDDAMEEESEEDVGGTLEEVLLPGLESNASTLYVGNVQAGDRLLQITDTEVRLIAWSGEIVSRWAGQITVAAANEAGQIAVALQGGMLVYLAIEGDKVEKLYEKQMDREVSCVDIHPFAVLSSGDSLASSMDIDAPDESERLCYKSSLIAVGLWDDFTVRLLSIGTELEEILCIALSTDEEEETAEAAGSSPSRRNRNNMMARSLSLITLDFSSSAGGHNSSNTPSMGVNMLFVGLGDGTLISFAVVRRRGVISVQSKKEVCLGTQRIGLTPLSTEQGGSCLLATGDRPTVIYLAGVGGTSANQFNPKLCYSNVNVAATDVEEIDDISRPPSQQSITVNVATPFFSPLLFDAATLGNQHYSLCVADDSSLRLGVIDDIQKLHVTTCRLGMAPRRIVHCPDGRLFAVGCIESGIQNLGLGRDETNMGNCIRFMDDTTFDDLERVDLEPYEMILSMLYATLKVPVSSADAAVASTSGAAQEPSYKPFLLVGTAYALPDQDEPTRGRILVYSCQGSDDVGTQNSGRAVRQITEFAAEGGVYSMCQFYEGKILVNVNTKTHLCQIVEDTEMLRLEYQGVSVIGHILSLFVKSRAQRMPLEQAGSAAAASDALALDVAETQSEKKKESHPEQMLAIVGDLMRSICLVQYYPQHQTLEEVARDFNTNWTCAVEMLTDNVYLGAENWKNLFCLRRNTAASSEEIRCRLDTIGEFHLGELCNKFMSGSLVMPVSNNNNSSSNNSRRSVRRGSPSKKKAESPGKASGAGRVRRPVVSTGSQTLFGTVDGTLGVILGLDGRTTAFFSTLERAMARIIKHVGEFEHEIHRAVRAERRDHPSNGFVDGDLVESFLDLDRTTMEAIVAEMNRDGGWEFDDSILRNEGEDKDDSSSNLMAEDRPELTVDDVLAMVEEMTMLH